MIKIGEALRSRPVFSACFPGDALPVLSLVPRNEAVQIVAIGAVRAKRPFVKQALDSATQTNLVGVSLGANRPTQLSVPAAAKDDHPNAGQAGCQNSPRPQPSSLFLADRLIGWHVHYLVTAKHSI